MIISLENFAELIVVEFEREWMAEHSEQSGSVIARIIVAIVGDLVNFLS